MKLKVHPGLGDGPVIGAVVEPTVGPPDARPSPVSVDAGLVPAFVKGSVVGFVVVFTLLAGVTLLAGMGLGAAIGVGVFTAAWGGPGFGGMLGAVLHYDRTQGT